MTRRPPSLRHPPISSWWAMWPSCRLSTTTSRPLQSLPSGTMPTSTRLTSQTSTLPPGLPVTGCPTATRAASLSLTPAPCATSSTRRSSTSVTSLPTTAILDAPSSSRVMTTAMATTTTTTHGAVPTPPWIILPITMSMLPTATIRSIIIRTTPTRPPRVSPSPAAASSPRRHPHSAPATTAEWVWPTTAPTATGTAGTVPTSPSAMSIRWGTAGNLPL